jgi:glucosamine--fructose-6-phosphate aminotransferase (isomerizing)
MCGIVAYLGDKQAYPILINGLRRLEYRGYDSAGVALVAEGNIHVHKCQGRVSDLEAHGNGADTSGTVGIGHTRWATHGPPNDVNAHPHVSTSGDLALIHNGIIENYAAIKEELLKRGHTFKSDTDTEVLVHLIDDIQQEEGVDLAEAVRLALTSVVGAYAIVVIDRKSPDLLVAARKSSPLVIGIGADGEHFVASDATPIVEHTKNVVYLEDGEIALMDRKAGLKIRSISNQVKTPFVQELELHLEALEKGGYDHFMLKEIHEQPRSIRDCLRGRQNLRKGEVVLGGITEYEQKFINAKRILIVGCGTSWHAGLVGEYLFEDLARIPVEVEYASEFSYRNPVINEDDRRHPGGDRTGQGARRHHHRDLQRRGQQHRAGHARGFVHPRGTRDRCGQHEGLHRPGHRAHPHGPDDRPEEGHDHRQQLPPPTERTGRDPGQSAEGA